MQSLKNIYQYLLSELNFSPLYHTTKSFKQAMNIIKTDRLGGYKISTSRNKKFGFQIGTIRFILNREKLVQRYKIEPYVYGGGGKKGIYGKEAEEVIHGPIKNLHKYVEWIEVMGINHPRLSKLESLQKKIQQLKQFKDNNSTWKNIPIKPWHS